MTAEREKIIVDSNWAGLQYFLPQADKSSFKLAARLDVVALFLCGMHGRQRAPVDLSARGHGKCRNQFKAIWNECQRNAIPNERTEVGSRN
jgi:hypothetical protein